MLFASIAMPAKSPVAGAQDSSSRATVVFGDGGTVEVDALRFRYDWIYSEDQKYVNPTIRSFESADLHYADVVRNVELSRTVPRVNLARIELTWPDGFRPDRIVVHLKDGTSKEIKDYRATSEFLLSGSPNETRRAVTLQALYATGKGIIEGQRGRFAARLTTRSGSVLEPRERVTEIIFR
jgi:hypothetical protein